MRKPKFIEEFDSDGNLTGYTRVEQVKVHYLSLNLAAEVTGRDRKYVTKVARELESHQGPKRARLYYSPHLLEAIYTGDY
jgi:hypothetical protein